MSAMVEEAPPAATRRSPTRLVIQAVVSLVLVVVIFYFLLKKIDLAQVWTAITDMTWLELTILGLLAIWNLCTYAFVWMAVTPAPGLSFGRAMVMTQSTTAVANTVPGGSAIGIGMTYNMLGSWGYSRSRTTTAVLVSGVWNSFIKLGMPVLALALVALRDVGVSDAEVSWAQVLAAFAFARLITALPYTPGGLGAVEVTLIATLSAAGGDRSEVAAGVLVYRALQWALPILVGAATYLWWRRSQLRPQPITAGGPPLAIPEAGGPANTDRSGTQASDGQPQP